MKIFILESDNSNSYRVAIHFATPLGNNAVGVSWKACGLASGMIGFTSLEVGTGPCNITLAELDEIDAGNTIEIIRSVNPGIDPSNAEVSAICNIRVSEYQLDMARILKYYGHTIGV